MTTTGLGAEGALTASRTRASRISRLVLGRREAVFASAVLLAAAVTSLLPHILHGGFYTDDWVFAAVYKQNAGLKLIHDFGNATPGRPALALYLPTAFALFGLHVRAQLAWVAVLTAGLGTVTYATLRLLRFPPYLGLLVATALVVFPFADSTKLWMTGSVIELSLLFCIAGIATALVAFRMNGLHAIGAHLASLALYAASITSYEATVGLILCVGIAYLAAGTKRAALARWATDVVTTMVIVFTITSSTVKTVHRGLGDEVHHAGIIFWQAAALLGRVLVPIGSPLSRDGALGLVGGTIVAGGLTALMGPRDRRGEARRATLLLLAGVCAIVAGYLVYIPADDYYSPYGTEQLNRVNSAASPGYVLVAVGLVCTLATVLAGRGRVRAVLVSIVVGCLVAGYTVRLIKDEHLWDRAAGDERAALVDLTREIPARERATSVVYVWRSRTELTSQLPVFNSTWDLPNAVRIGWSQPTARAFPLLSTTVFHCGTSRMYPTGGLYSTAQGALYGHGIFVDEGTGRAFAVDSPDRCAQLVRSLSTPEVRFQPLPRSVSSGSALSVSVDVNLGREPLDALGVRIFLPSDPARTTCDAVSLPTGVVRCSIGLPAGVLGHQEIIASFKGTPSLRAVSIRGSIDVTPL